MLVLHARRAPLVGAFRMVGTVLGSSGTRARCGQLCQRGKEPTAGMRVQEITGSAGRVQSFLAAACRRPGPGLNGLNGCHGCKAWGCPRITRRARRGHGGGLHAAHGQTHQDSAASPNGCIDAWFPNGKGTPWRLLGQFGRASPCPCSRECCAFSWLRPLITLYASVFPLTS